MGKFTSETAVEAGRRGGVSAAGKGGRVRAAAMTAEARREHARRMAEARWVSRRAKRGAATAESKAVE